MQVFGSMIVSMLKGYLIKLASKEFVEWAFFEIAEAMVKSTKTDTDDKWLAKIRKTVK